MTTTLPSPLGPQTAWLDASGVGARDHPDLGVTQRPALAEAVDPAEPRRNTATVRDTDIFATLGAAAAAIGLTALLFGHVAPLSGKLGFVVVAYVMFLGTYVLLVSFESSGPAVRDRIASVFVHSLGFLLLLALVFVVGYTFYRGREALTHLNFFTKDLSATGPLDGLEVGGILHAVEGTLIMISIALAITIPLGITCALCLSELPGGFSRFVRTISEAMTALPSIVAGLFIYATAVQIIGKSGFAAALAISLMMLPIIIRAADVVLRLVPGSLKEASLALGAGQWRTAWHVTLPTSRSGLTTAVILGTARGIGETSPVLLTAGFTQVSNHNPFQGPMVSLPLATFNLVGQPQATQISRGFGTAATLMVLVLVLFFLARLIGGRGPGNITPRQARRRTRESLRDAARWRSDFVEAPLLSVDQPTPTTTSAP